MAVSLANIRANAYTTMYNHLQTGTYKISTDNIHSSYNDTQSAKEGYPQVIIEKPIISMEKITMGRVSPVFHAIVNYNINVFHTSAENAQAIADEVMNKIRTGLSVFYAVNMKNFIFDEDSTDRVYRGAKSSVHIYRLVIICRYIGSA